LSRGSDRENFNDIRFGDFARLTNSCIAAVVIVPFCCRPGRTVSSLDTSLLSTSLGRIARLHDAAGIAGSLQPLPSYRSGSQSIDLLCRGVWLGGRLPLRLGLLAVAWGLPALAPHLGGVAAVKLEI